MKGITTRMPRRAGTLAVGLCLAALGAPSAMAQSASPAPSAPAIAAAPVIPAAPAAPPEAAALAGRIKTLSGSAQIVRQDQTLAAAPGMPVLRQDRIVTASGSYVGITLVDNSLLTLGPNGQVELSDVRFDSTTHDGRIWLRLVRGSLQVITGLVAKLTPQNMRIETPHTVLGVRGTHFIVDLDERRP